MESSAWGQVKVTDGMPDQIWRVRFHDNSMGGWKTKEFKASQCITEAGSYWFYSGSRVAGIVPLSQVVWIETLP